MKISLRGSVIKVVHSLLKHSWATVFHSVQLDTPGYQSLILCHHDSTAVSGCRRQFHVRNIESMMIISHFSQP